MVVRYKDEILKQEDSVCGIYQLFFGDYFYIGRSVNIKRRAAQHLKEINHLIRFDSIPNIHYLKNVFDLIKSNPKLSTIEVYLEESCTSSELHGKEQKWLTFYKNNKYCLNVGFISNPSSYDTKITNEAGAKENSSREGYACQSNKQV